MPRSNQTKQLLAQSLQELMATTPLEKISVNDIVDHANVGRNTFYYHFEDINALLAWSARQDLEQMIALSTCETSWQAGLLQLLQKAEENRRYMKHT